MGFTKLKMCGCIYYKIVGTEIILIYDFVDDFIWTGSNSELVESIMDEYQKHAQVTPRIKNPEKVLGMEIRRNRDKRAIGLSLIDKAEEMMEKLKEYGILEELDISPNRFPKVPIVVNSVVIGDEAFDLKLIEGKLAEHLTMTEITKYLGLVGALIWQIGLRNDILFAVLYASWNTAKPRKYHLKIVAKTVMYVYATREKNILWLGGRDRIEVLTYTDMSMNTGPKGKSVIAYGTRLGPKAGLVSSKAKATVDVVLSSFEGELEGHEFGAEANMQTTHCIGGLAEAFKQGASVQNVLQEIKQYPYARRIYADNEAMVDFVNGDAQGKGMKHASLRLWYIRQQIDRGYTLDWTSGEFILANPMTKAVHVEEQDRHVIDVQGLKLLEEDELKPVAKYAYIV